MADHTPAPWDTEGHDTVWGLLDADGRRIALIDKGGLNAAPNARLIASAPDLLEALEVLRSNIGAASLTRNMRGIEVRAKADAAIAKARGNA